MAAGFEDRAEGAGGARRRPLYVSTACNKIDAKGRVSVPADFRKVLAGREFEGVYAFPSFTNPVIECGGEELLEDMKALIAELDPFDEDREAFELVVMGETKKLAFDANGRILLPDEFVEFAGLAGYAQFVGLGDRFQIWSPEAYAAKVRTARDRARANRAVLGAKSRLAAGKAAE